jgi:hypothetical protein
MLNKHNFIFFKFNALQQSEESGFPIEEILQGLGKAIDEFLADDNNSNWKLKRNSTFKNVD